MHLLGCVLHGRLLRSTGRGIGSVSLFMSNILTSDDQSFVQYAFAFVFNDVVWEKVVSSVHLLLGWVKVVSSALVFLTSATWWTDFCCVALAVALYL